MGRPHMYAALGLAIEVYDARAAMADSRIEGDIAFYLDLALAGDGAVLELAVGTGRIALPLAAEGLDVVGLDLSPAMLSVAEAKRATLPPDAHLQLVTGDMADFTLSRTFGTIIVAFRSFQTLLTPEDQRRALMCIRRHLRPDGRAVVHLFDPRLDLLLPGGPPPPVPEAEVVNPTTGRRVHVEITERTVDPLSQCFRETWRFVERGAHGAAARTEDYELVLRWTYRWEMRHLFELCGLAVEAEYSDFQRAPPRYGGEQIWVVKRD